MNPEATNRTENPALKYARIQVPLERGQMKPVPILIGSMMAWFIFLVLVLTGILPSKPEPDPWNPDLTTQMLDAMDHLNRFSTVAEIQAAMVTEGMSQPDAQRIAPALRKLIGARGSNNVDFIILFATPRVGDIVEYFEKVAKQPQFDSQKA